MIGAPIARLLLTRHERTSDASMVMRRKALPGAVEKHGVFTRYLREIHEDKSWGVS